ncbi:MAG: IS630 family transposase [Thermodesulfobacteriota bacterium]|nr:IS630 family transposase [Thermodesulfobacteriota bacterium]
MARPLLIPYPENASIEELKQVARIGSSETTIRCTAIQMLLAGADRELVRNSLLITNRALRKWINRFNHSGVDGIIAKKRPGRTEIIRPEQKSELAELIDQPQQAERTFWTAKAFHGYISDVYQVECSYRTVVRFFHKQGFALKTPQPWSDKQDEQLRENFLQELEQLFNQPDVDIWFADESGFEGDPRPRRRWDKKGRKTRITKNGGHLRMNVIGMVCPRTGQFFAIEASHSDSATFQAFLDEANKIVSFQRTKNVLIMDNASWHRKNTTTWHGWQPKYLPPYSPDLNPIERIWNIMKARWFNNHVCKNEEKLLERLDLAILDIIDNPKSTQKTTAIGTLF